MAVFSIPVSSPSSALCPSVFSWSWLCCDLTCVLFSPLGWSDSPGNSDGTHIDAQADFFWTPWTVVYVLSRPTCVKHFTACYIFLPGAPLLIKQATMTLPSASRHPRYRCLYLPVALITVICLAPLSTYHVILSIAYLLTSHSWLPRGSFVCCLDLFLHPQLLHTWILEASSGSLLHPFSSPKNSVRYSYCPVLSPKPHFWIVK